MHMTGFHEHRVLTDRDPEALAYGLIHTFRAQDDLTFKKLLTAAVTRGPHLFEQTIARLLDLVMPHAHHFEFTAAHEVPDFRMQNVVVARVLGLPDLYGQAVAGIWEQGEAGRAVQLATLTQLAAGLADRGRLEVPVVAFTSMSSS